MLNIIIKQTTINGISEKIKFGTFGDSENALILQRFGASVLNDGRQRFQ